MEGRFLRLVVGKNHKLLSAVERAFAMLLPLIGLSLMAATVILIAQDVNVDVFGFSMFLGASQQFFIAKLGK